MPGSRTVRTGSSAHDVQIAVVRFGSGSNPKGDMTPDGHKQ
ncbi:hypothetical protein [Paenibacillus lautus]|nr:hypothetical protein [Paenibacillus lautus]